MSSEEKDERALGGLLKNFIRENNLQKGIDKVNAEAAWESIMGPGVNSYTGQVSFRQGTLYVTLTSSVLREELSHGRSKIVRMLNEELGSDVVQKLILR